jgi:glucose/arabinose dehydrogenase
MRARLVSALLSAWILCGCHGASSGGPGGTGPPLPDLSWLAVPDGFRVHYFGNVGNARQLRFAPNGDLFVASPTTTTTGDGPNGRAEIVVLPDDDHDGIADRTITFLSGLPSTQGLLFDGGFLYYQDGTAIRRLPYALGQRQGSVGDVVADIRVYVSELHWPKSIDVARDGTLFVTNGGDQEETCDPARPFHGGILRLDGTGGVVEVAKGFRNPIALRCSLAHDGCFAAELSLDYSAELGGREKIVPVRDGDDWGFPCCATKDLPYRGITPVPDCSQVVAESVAFIIGETPFGMEFEPGRWPAPFTNDLFVTLHGDFGTWVGARLAAISTDPVTGAPLAASDLDGGTGPASFATGWDDGKQDHGRPAALAMSPDGRLFLSNDANGDIVWIAPAS